MNFSILKASEIKKAVIRDICRQDIMNKDLLASTKKKKKTGMIVCLFLMAAGIAGSILWWGHLRVQDPKLLAPAGIGFVIGLIGIFSFAGASKALKNYRPQKKVTSIKIAMLPIGSVLGSQGRYLFDQSGLAETVELVFPSANAPDQIRKIEEVHKQLSAEVPDILPPENPTNVRLEDYETDHILFGDESKLHMIYQKTVDIFDSMESEKLTTPLLRVSPDELNDLVKLVGRLNNSGDWSGCPEIRNTPSDFISQVGDIIARLEGEVDPEGDLSRERQKVTTLFTGFLSQIRKDQKNLAMRRTNSLAGVMPNYSKELERLAVMSSYNCYCPKCNGATINSSAEGNWDSSSGEFPSFDFATRMKPVPGGLLWECPVCAHRTEQPFPVHRILDDLVYPTMDRLLQENRVERLRIYHQAQEKKRQVIDAMQKDIRLLAEATKKEAREFQARIREIASGVDGAKATIELLAEEMASLDALRNSRISQLSSQMNQHIQKIAEFKRHTMSEYNKSMDRIMEEASKDLKHLAKVARQEEQARMNVQRQIAENLSKQNQLSEKQIELSEKQNKHLEEGNAMTEAQLRQTGGYDASFPNVMGQAKELAGDVEQALTGKSDYDRAKDSMFK